MPVTFTVTADNGPEAAIQIRNFVAALQLNQHPEQPGTEPVKQPDAPLAAAPATAQAEEPKKAKKEKAAKEEAKAETTAAGTPKYTLQQAIDAAKEIAIGSGQSAEVMNALSELNTSFGIAKVRELPPEKLDAYMEALLKKFPKKEEKAADGSMFD